MFNTKYRIVRDSWLGFEVQIWRWWWPFWTDHFNGKITNTFATVDRAEEFIKTGHVVKYVDAP